ncbi:OmpP1/FadL family transporter [Rhodobacter ferrooxidans]|uniref:Membrane protein involved in aromatic hydrocarbon degradation n=1 Tax=Rhodobacter ferrooxidans TaxID=371731 RepID=C8S353_9RHOB|nr:outer membrane protein transport protein [Rhodobacter sp. SW2]EEW24535.1 membrane protein involved in aromatic hydrocarbon degradation [Rhodobacter sp. SW2]
MRRKWSARRLAGVAAVMAAGLGAPAHATEGYVALGFGPIQRGQGGAGVATTGFDAMSGTINPAATATVGRSLSLGMEVFSPSRGYTADGTFFVAPGSHRSNANYFPIPNFAYNTPLASGGVLTFSAYGNGGMNTTYGNFANANCGGGSGVYCGGAAGVDLTQLFLSVAYARKDGALSWGIAPVVAVQAFKAKGLAAFGAISSDPTSLSNNGLDWSYGIGLRAGLIYELSSAVSFGLSAQSKFNMSKFSKYAGLFENGGDFDIPAQVTAGVAVKASPDVTLMLDYQRIFYSGVKSVSNGFVTTAPLGAPGATGFGWDDVDVIKLGVAWQQNDQMTWRAGYAHSSNPLGSEDVTLGLLAPGVVTNHFTLGGSYAASERDSFDFAVEYAPNVKVSGGEVTPGGPTPGRITVDMDQVGVSFGWRRTF